MIADLCVSGSRKYKATISLPVACAIDPINDPFDFLSKISMISSICMDCAIFARYTIVVKSYLKYKIGWDINFMMISRITDNQLTRFIVFRMLPNILCWLICEYLINIINIYIYIDIHEYKTP